MTKYYSADTQGFYDSVLHGKNMPKDSVEITEEKHRELLEAQATGLTIKPDEKGYPIAVKQEPSLPELVSICHQQIDDAAKGVYSQYIPLSEEYKLRENEAQAFKSMGFNGDAPDQVQAFAESAGIDPEIATNIILSQAVGLRSAIAEIGKLRMRKFELNKMEDVDSVRSTAQEIIAAIKAVGDEL